MIWLRRQLEHRLFVGAAILVILVSAFCLLVKDADIQLTVETVGEMKNPGDIVTMDVTMTGNSNFASLQSFETYINYDRERLKLVSVNSVKTKRNGDTLEYLPGAQVSTQIENIDGQDYGHITATMSSPVTEPMLTIFSITFHVLSVDEGLAEVQLQDAVFTGMTMKAAQPEELSIQMTDGGIHVSDLLCEHRNTSDYYTDNGDKTHSVNKICICGEELHASKEACTDDDMDTFCDGCNTQLFQLERVAVVGSNMALGNELQINYIIPATLGAGSQYTANITQISGREEIRVIEVPQSEWQMFDASHRRISVRVRAKEMADKLTLEIYDQNGYLCSEPYTTSVQSYVKTVLQAPGVSAYMKTLAVDMLNYGTAAQEYFEYNIQNLADAVLTDEQKVLASTSGECKDRQVKGLNNRGSNLVLEDCIQLNMFFEGLYGKNVDHMYAKVSFTDFTGKEKNIHVLGEKLDPFGGDGDCYKLCIEDIVLADARCLVTVNLYYADGTLFGYGSDSVESYIARASEADGAPLYDAIMRFADSAYNYLTS